MKTVQKWVCLVLTLLIILGMPSAAFAGGRVTPQWASGGAAGTHQFLTGQAISILLADNPAVANLLTLEYRNLLLTNSDWPDTYENDGGLYTSHFYNPYTGKTFLGSTTALTRFTTHANNAKKYYAKNKKQSMTELGRALHYLADINEPHHAALLIAGLSSHTQYEDWIDSNEYRYAITTVASYKTFITTDAKRSYATYCTELFRKAAFNAYSFKDLANTYDTLKWEQSAAGTLPFAQESMAVFLYNFLYAVGAVK